MMVGRSFGLQVGGGGRRTGIAIVVVRVRS